jgi:hypothetical protein
MAAPRATLALHNLPLTDFKDLAWQILPSARRLR